ncbi:MAG TPA: hypothetical protein DD728_15825 [Hyphomonas atlantica]|uniref:Uncharacterized protein n=1 Tax=Hyphomonas atlantica TaxID=1280948 RepID=A0A356WBC8_9PROT|nr:hypothetical protein [Hyphomonas atlantica]
MRRLVYLARDGGLHRMHSMRSSLRKALWLPLRKLLRSALRRMLRTSLRSADGKVTRDMHRNVGQFRA